MGAERHEERAHEAAGEMERGAERMGQELDRLGEHIDDAQKAADKRPEAGSDLLEDATAADPAGDDEGREDGDAAPVPEETAVSDDPAKGDETAVSDDPTA